jgi:hypothetical protein
MPHYGDVSHSVLERFGIRLIEASSEKFVPLNSFSIVEHVRLPRPHLPSSMLVVYREAADVKTHHTHHNRATSFLSLPHPHPINTTSHKPTDPHPTYCNSAIPLPYTPTTTQPLNHSTTQLRQDNTMAIGWYCCTCGSINPGDWADINNTDIRQVAVQCDCAVANSQ